MADLTPASTSDADFKRPAPVPEPAVRRLSLYLRQLEAFQVSGLLTASSKQLADPLGFTDAQVRKDLGYFGQFGKPGKGYSVTSMIATIRKILGTDRIWNVVLVGAGNLGSALAGYRGFARKGFRIVAAFDKDASKTGQSLGTDPALGVLPMEQLPEVVRQKNARLAILAVPADAAQQVAEQLAMAGIYGVLNFAPITLALPQQIKVNDVDLAVELEQIAFHVNNVNQAANAGNAGGGSDAGRDKSR
jgi:redox-sensing transcriptional repressor